MKSLKYLLPFLLLAACAHNPKSPNPQAAYTPKSNRTPAQDNSRTYISHVSKTGRYIAFFEEASLDGSGADYTAFRILDLKEDKYIFNKAMVSNEDEENRPNSGSVQARQKADLLALAKFKLKTNHLLENNLAPVQNNSTIDLPNDAGNWMNEKLTTKGSFKVGDKEYTYEVSDSAATADHLARDMKWCIGSGYEPRLYTIKINGAVAHSDSRLPRSRGCAFAYGVDKVFDIKGKPLLFIRYKTLGFEGPDYRTITLPIYNP